MKRWVAISLLALVATSCTAAAAGQPAPAPYRAPAMVHSVRVAPPSGALILGDSWTAAWGASDAQHGWAQLAVKALHWKAAIDGYAGSGYVGHVGPSKTFAQDFGTAPVSYRPALVVVQGGTNDHGTTDAAIRVAVAAVVRLLHARFPGARLVFLGPMANNVKAEAVTLRVSNAIASALKPLGVTYIDAQPWFPAASLAKFINVKAGYHPSNAGHAYIATRFEQAARRLNLRV
jgi:lysophospholipase L1-like esterase